MSTLEYTISLLETMPEDKLKEIQNYIQYIIFRDDETKPFKLHYPFHHFRIIRFNQQVWISGSEIDSVLWRILLRRFLHYLRK